MSAQNVNDTHNKFPVTLPLNVRRLNDDLILAGMIKEIDIYGDRVLFRMSRGVDNLHELRKIQQKSDKDMKKIRPHEQHYQALDNDQYIHAEFRPELLQTLKTIPMNVEIIVRISVWMISLADLDDWSDREPGVHVVVEEVTIVKWWSKWSDMDFEVLRKNN